MRRFHLDINWSLVYILYFNIFFNSDRWGNSQFCGLCICSRNTCNSFGSFKHHFQVWNAALCSQHILRTLNLTFNTLDVKKQSQTLIMMQCSASSLYLAREIAHVWCAWMYPLYGGVYNYCFACTTWEKHPLCQGRVETCYRTR